MTEKMLGIKEAAEELGVSIHTLYTWVYQKKIPYIKLGKLVKFRPTALERFIEKHEVSAEETN